MQRLQRNYPMHVAGAGLGHNAEDGAERGETGGENA